MVMVVDIEGVGQDMYSLPIKAESEVPVVEIKPKDTLNFDEIFLRDPDTRGITIINNSTLKAKFIVLPQNDESKALATYKVDVESDTIERSCRDSAQSCIRIKRLKRSWIVEGGMVDTGEAARFSCALIFGDTSLCAYK